MAELDQPGAFTGEIEPEQRVIRVDQAIDCCRESVNVALRAYRDLASIINFAVRTDDRSDESVYALIAPGVAVPAIELGPSALPRVVRLPGPGALVPLAGAAYIVGLVWELGQALDQAGKAEIAGAILSLTQGLLQMNIRPRTAKAIKESPCASCMMNRALQQHNPRAHYRLVKHGQTVGSINTRKPQ
jgi:hypothetical protein